MAKANAKAGTRKTAKKKTPAKQVTPPEEEYEAALAVEEEEEEKAGFDETIGAEPASPRREGSSAIDAETHAKYEQIKRGEIHITELQKMTVAEHWKEQA